MDHSEVNTVMSVIQAVWPVFAGFVLMIAWFIRLESKVLNMESNHVGLKIHQEKTTDELWSKFGEVQKTMNDVLMAIGRVEGRIDGGNDHTRRGSN